MQTQSHENAEVEWFCLRSQPKREGIAAANLRKEFGIEVFSPRIRFRRSTRQGIVWATESLFPNYLFARFEPVQMLRKVRHAHGVSGVVQFGGKMAHVPAREIEVLRQRVADNETIVVEPTVQVGDKVDVGHGPLAGMRAVVSQVLPGRERVRVLLEFLGGVKEVEVGLNSVLCRGVHPLAS